MPKCPLPMKGTGGRSADSGEGWLLVSTRWPRSAGMKARLVWAWLPQSMKTTGRSPWAMWRITASVSSSQPLPEWLAAWPSSTVRQVLSSSTPFLAHLTRLPPGLGKGGKGTPRSRCISLKMFCREGGMRTPGATENDRPSACPRPWYGSWPRMTTRTSSGGVSSSARSGCGGKTTAPACRRWCKKVSSCCPVAPAKKSSTSGCQPGATGQSAGSADWS